MENYAKGNKRFKDLYFKKNEKELIDLAKNGQSPKALFIGCADSRVIPDLMVQTKPGDLFVLRNVGNFVPPYKPDEDYHATASGIEYAVSVLKVKEIIICGHTHCGACRALYDEINDDSLIHTKKWLSLGSEARQDAVSTLGSAKVTEELLRLTERYSVLVQIKHLLSYPNVKALEQSGDLHIHGWHYDIENGSISYYDPDDCKFKPLEEI